MKILYLATHFNYGGITTYVYSLAKSLSERGHEIVVASSGGQVENALRKIPGIHHLTIPIKTKSELSPKVVVSSLVLKRLLLKHRVDIIHSHTRVTSVVAGYLKRTTKIPYVTTCHGFYRRNIGRQLLPMWGDLTIAISDAVKKHLMIDFFVPENRIRLVPNSIDVANFRVDPIRLDTERPLRKVGIVARLSPVKGHAVLIKAMKKVVEEYPDACLLIFGEGKIKYSLIAIAEELKIMDRVLFLPSVANTSEVLREIDIFVLPSLDEGLGLSILEAQACGIPVVASRVGGIPSIVKNNQTGLLVPPGDVDALSGAILKLMDNSRLAVTLGHEGRLTVEEKFDMSRMVEEMEKVYQEVIRNEK